MLYDVKAAYRFILSVLFLSSTSGEDITHFNAQKQVLSAGLPGKK